MPEDRLERKTYRKSPGRQYGYEYDPLQSRNGKSQTGSTASRSGVLLSQRPDPRRTRQLLRQSIIASRRSEDDETLEQAQPELREPTRAPDKSRPTRRIQNAPAEDPRPSGKHHIARTRFVPIHDEDEQLPPRYGANNGRAAAPAESYRPSARQPMYNEEVVQEAWPRQERYVDPDLGIDEDEGFDDLEQETYDYAPPPRTRGLRADVPSRASSRLATRHLPEEPLEDDPYEEYVYDEDEALPEGLHVVQKTPSSRRRFLIGAGVVVAGGATVGLIASQANPKSPFSQAINHIPQAATYTQQQVNDAVTQARKALLTELHSLDTFTLEAAVESARLTRTAYDVFVAPIIKFTATITNDVLVVLLNTLESGRNFLKTVPAATDVNNTLGSLQNVLQSWSDNVQKLPKQLNAIAETDLDGAQAYLQALQRKIQDEQNALNATPTPQANPSPTPKKS